MQYVIAFVTGGMICALSQILMEKTKMLPGRIMVLLVCLGAILGFAGIYEPFSQWAQAGANVRFWDLETISGRGSKRWWTRKGLSVFFWAALKTVRQGFPQHSFFLILLPCSASQR